MAPDGVWPAAPHPNRIAAPTPEHAFKHHLVLVAAFSEEKESSWLPKHRSNALDDDRQSADDELIRKSQYAKARAPKPCISLGVPDFRVRRLVRPAVRFDNDFSGKANEIREAGADRRLPAKAESVEPMIAHRVPKHRLRLRHFATLSPSELA
jgi:hypothetical protein